MISGRRSCAAFPAPAPAPASRSASGPDMTPAPTFSITRRPSSSTASSLCSRDPILSGPLETTDRTPENARSLHPSVAHSRHSVLPVPTMC